MNRPRSVVVIILCLTALSCSNWVDIQHEAVVTADDFTQYTKGGFLFTPLSLSGEYESVGIITVRIIPTFIKTDTRDAPSQADVNSFRVFRTANAWYWLEKISRADVVAEIHRVAAEMGADALTQFRIEIIPLDVGDDMSVDTYQASGYAVKRKN